MKLTELIGQDLSNFSLEEMFEVYKAGEEGEGKASSVGIFRKEDIAKAIAQNQIDAPWHRVDKCLVLTNGDVAFLITAEEVTLLSNEEVALQIREKVLSKLSEEERKVLNL